MKRATKEDKNPVDLTGTDAIILEDSEHTTSNTLCRGRGRGRLFSHTNPISMSQTNMNFVSFSSGFLVSSFNPSHSKSAAKAHSHQDQRLELEYPLERMIYRSLCCHLRFMLISCPLGTLENEEAHEERQRKNEEVTEIKSRSGS